MNETPLKNFLLVEQRFMRPEVTEKLSKAETYLSLRLGISRILTGSLTVEEKVSAIQRLIDDSGDRTTTGTPPTTTGISERTTATPPSTPLPESDATSGQIVQDEVQPDEHQNHINEDRTAETPVQQQQHQRVHFPTVGEWEHFSGARRSKRKSNKQL